MIRWKSDIALIHDREAEAGTTKVTPRTYHTNDMRDLACVDRFNLNSTKNKRSLYEWTGSPWLSPVVQLQRYLPVPLPSEAAGSQSELRACLVTTDFWQQDTSVVRPANCLLSFPCSATTRGPAGAVCFSFTSDSDLRTGDGGKLWAKTLWSLFASSLFVLVESDDHACVVAGLPLNLSSSWSSSVMSHHGKFINVQIMPQDTHHRESGFVPSTRRFTKYNLSDRYHTLRVSLLAN